MLYKIKPGYESQQGSQESPVLFKLKAAYDSSSPDTNTGSKRVLIDLPLLERLRISSSSAHSSQGSGNLPIPVLPPGHKAPICESESLSSSSTISQPILPRAPVCIGSELDKRSDKKSEKSDASSTDFALMSNTATKCLNNRRAKRSKNLRRKNLRELRRSSKDKLSPLSPSSLPKSPLSPGAIAHRTNGTPPRSRHSSTETSYLRSSLRLAASSGSGRQGDHLIEMLTGCSPQVMRKVTDIAKSRWTVAVEIESGNGIFGE